MKVAFLCESPIDEAAVSILAAAILGAPVTPLDDPKIAARPGGCDPLLRSIPVVLRRLHYYGERTGLVILVDSDDTPIHTIEHESQGQRDPDCRLCRVLSAVDDVRRGLRDEPLAVHVAAGLPVPCIEAWLLCGTDPHVGEAQWVEQQRNRPTEAKRHVRNALKRQLYGTAQPGREIGVSRATQEAERLAADLDLLRNWFPDGFGMLERMLRGWPRA